jgi:hypothetical protein
VLGGVAGDELEVVAYQFPGSGFHVTAGVGGVMASMICSCLAWLLVMGWSAWRQ